jgi:hypothetical protein
MGTIVLAQCDTQCAVTTINLVSIVKNFLVLNRRVEVSFDKENNVVVFFNNANKKFTVLGLGAI